MTYRQIGEATVSTQNLLGFIRRDLLNGESDPSLDEHADLIDRGLIDSIGLMRLVTFIEQELGVKVPDDEVVPDNFQTVASMEAMVSRLRSSRA
jgi:acyl carrier protein